MLTTFQTDYLIWPFHATAITSFFRLVMCTDRDKNRNFTFGTKSLCFRHQKIDTFVKIFRVEKEVKLNFMTQHT